MLPKFKRLTPRQLDWLNYQADLEDDIERRDYTRYAQDPQGVDGEAVRQADQAYLAKVIETKLGTKRIAWGG